MNAQVENKIVAQAKYERAAMVKSFFANLFSRKHEAIAQA